MQLTRQLSCSHITVKFSIPYLVFTEILGHLPCMEGKSEVLCASMILSKGLHKFMIGKRSEHRALGYSPLYTDSASTLGNWRHHTDAAADPAQVSHTLQCPNQSTQKDGMSVHAKLLQSCQTPCDPMDFNPPGSSVHGILQTRILEEVVMPSFRGSS